jgi:hypothetical protein
MTLESKNCKACRPKRKPPTKLSAKEIHNRVQSGDMNNFVADKLREKRQRDAHNKQGMASRNRWYSEWKAELKDALMPITREIVSARSAWTYARDKGYIDKAEFYFEYHGMLKHEKTHAEMSYMLTPRRPVSARWADYISPAVFTRVRDMWAALPPVYKHSRIPLLITYRDAFTQVNKDGKFVPPRSLAYLKGEK